jgi:hypothetical protein
MSTSDPRVERIERQARAAHSPGALITLLITGAAHTAIWIAAGYGIGILLDTFRLMSVNQVGNWTSALDGTSSQLLGIGAIAVGSVLGVFFTGRLGRFGLGSAMIVPFCTAFLGIALGLVLFIPNWTAADLVGEKVPFIDAGEPEPWQSDAWVAYYLPFWLPAVVGVVFVLSVLGAVAVSRSTRRRSDRMRDIEARGTRVSGLGDVPARIHPSCRRPGRRLVRPGRTAQRDEDHGGSGPGCRAAHCDRPDVADRVSAGLE